MNGFFITGTDTDIGKTVLSSLLLAQFRKNGTNALPMKPVQTGCKNNIPDLDYILSMNTIETNSELISLMAPACYTHACSPHLAGAMENNPIEISQLLPPFIQLQKQADILLLEGAGGVLVPINKKENMLDLMNILQLPVIIAARPGLGTINHSLLTIQSLRDKEIDIAGIVFMHSHEQSGDFTEEDNKKTIAELGNIEILGTISYLREMHTPYPPKFSNLPASIKNEVCSIVDKLCP